MTSDECCRQPLEGMKRLNPGEPVEYIIQNTEKWRDAVFEPSQTPRWFSVFSSVQGSGQNYPWLSMFHTLSTKKTIVICCFFLRNLQIILPSHIRFKKPFFSDPKEKTHQDFHGKNKKIPASDAEDWKRRLNALKHLQGLVLGCSSDVPWMSQATKIWGNKRMGFGAAFFFMNF